MPCLPNFSFYQFSISIFSAQVFFYTFGDTNTRTIIAEWNGMKLISLE